MQISSAIWEFVGENEILQGKVASSLILWKYDNHLVGFQTIACEAREKGNKVELSSSSSRLSFPFNDVRKLNIQWYAELDWNGTFPSQIVTSK